MILTAAHLRSLLHYNPDSGVFTWLKRSGTTRGERVFNTQFAGLEAGSVCKHHGYKFIMIGGHRGRNYRAHRLAWLYMTGEWPCDEIGHKECDRSDTRWASIRAATHSQNHANAKIQKNNTSGFKSVHKNGDCWGSRITVRGEHIWLGTFPTRQAAAVAYLTAAKKHFGEFARV